MSSLNQRVAIKAKTWSRDSHGLFDYESRSVFVKYLESFTPCRLARNDLNIQLFSTSAPLSLLHNSHEHLADIILKNNSFALASQQEEPLWRIVSNLNSEGFSGSVLKEGNIMKIGRAKLRVKELKTEADPDSEEKEEDFILNGPGEENATCKICLGDENDLENPLVNPCACSGTMKYIHIECLQMWIQSRKVVKSLEDSVIYTWKSLDCELCKQPYPMKGSLEGKSHDFFQISKPVRPYIILEHINREKNNEIHVVSMMNKCMVKLGRGHDSDIRVSDISVSRIHATIRYSNKKFILEDNKSKFGTLLQVESPLCISKKKPLKVQIGRTVLSLSVKNELESKFKYSLQVGSSIEYCFIVGIFQPEKETKSEKSGSELGLMYQRGCIESEVKFVPIIKFQLYLLVWIPIEEVVFPPDLRAVIKALIKF